MQGKADANRLRLAEIEGQQVLFDEQMAEVVLAASVRQAHSDDQMARAELEARGMQTAYNMLACDNAEQKKAAAQVG